MSFQKYLWPSPSLPFSGILEHQETSGSVGATYPIALRVLHFFRVGFKPGQQKAASPKSYTTIPQKISCFVVLSFFFPPLLLEDYQQIPSIIFILFLWHITSDLFYHTVPLPSNHHLQIPHVLHGENSVQEVFVKPRKQLKCGRSGKGNYS